VCNSSEVASWQNLAMLRPKAEQSWSRKLKSLTWHPSCCSKHGTKPGWQLRLPCFSIWCVVANYNLLNWLTCNASAYMHAGISNTLATHGEIITCPWFQGVELQPIIRGQGKKYPKHIFCLAGCSAATRWSNIVCCKSLQRHHFNFKKGMRCMQILKSAEHEMLNQVATCSVSSNVHGGTPLSMIAAPKCSWPLQPVPCHCAAALLLSLPISPAF